MDSLGSSIIGDEDMSFHSPKDLVISSVSLSYTRVEEVTLLLSLLLSLSLSGSGACADLDLVFDWVSGFVDIVVVGYSWLTFHRF